MASVPSFWTEDGTYGTPHLSDKGVMSCQPSVPNALRREKKTKEFHSVVPLLEKDVDVKQLGEYHVGNGGCLHWVQPGVPDIIAAELANSLGILQGER